MSVFDQMNAAILADPNFGQPFTYRTEVGDLATKRGIFFSGTSVTDVQPQIHATMHILKSDFPVLPRKDEFIVIGSDIYKIATHPVDKEAGGMVRLELRLR